MTAQLPPGFELIDVAPAPLPPGFSLVPSGPQDERRKRIEEEVRAERKASPTLTAIDDKVRQLARGTPVGSWLDEANAGLASGLNKLSFGYIGRPYDDAVEYERAKDRIGDAESNNLFSLPVVGDVSTAGLTKLSGALLSAPMMPIGSVMQGATLVPRAVNAGASGAGYGLLYGAGEGDTLGERGGNAVIGAAIGGGLGALAPVAGAAVRNTVNRVRSDRLPMPAPLQPYSREAVGRVGQFMHMDNMSPVSYAREAQRLGPEGMLADMGENLTLATEGLYQQPGPQRQMIGGAFGGRGETALARIDPEIDNALGVAQTPGALNARLRAFNQQAQPLYDQFHNMQIPQTREIAQAVDRISRSEPGAMSEALRLAVAEGADPQYLTRLRNDPMTPMTGVQRRESMRAWSGVELDYIKRAVDDIARNADPGSNKQRVFRELARELRTAVDDAISPGNPGQSVWAQARAIARDGLEGREAYDLGANVFTAKRDPWQVQDEFGNLAQTGREMYRTAARNDLRGIAGRAATGFRANGDVTSRRALNSEFNQGNLQVLAGPQNAQRLLGRIDAENTFADTAGTVMGNSATARRQAVRDLIPRQVEDVNLANMKGESVAGNVKAIGVKLFNIMARDTLNERNARLARDMADILIAQGVDRDRLANAILSHARRQMVSRARASQIEGFVNNFIRGSATKLIEGRASE